MTITRTSPVEDRFENWISAMHTSLVENLGDDAANAKPDAWKSHITTINVGFGSYSFWCDTDYIFCNGVAILSCFNDHWTAEAIFFETLKLTFPDIQWTK